MDDNPLSDEELALLDDFLVSSAVGEDAMNLSMLDGFLTALAIGPNTLPPSTWMPLIWGKDMVWESRQQADRMISLVFRHANDLVFYLRDEPEDFEPLLYDHEVDGAAVPVLDEWCAGFVEAMALDEEAWQPLLDDPAGGECLRTILLHGTEDGWQTLENDPTLADRHDEFVARLGADVLAIHAWWLPVRKARSTVRREQPKTGRNAPCPCGSGKKFKHCCGGGRTLH